MQLFNRSFRSVAVAAGVAGAIVAGSAAAWAVTTEDDSAFGQQVRAQVRACKEADPNRVGPCISSWVRAHNPSEARETPESPEPSESPKPARSPEPEETPRPRVSPRPTERPDADERSEANEHEAPEPRPSLTPRPLPSGIPTHR